jgi:hypothetical protein
MSPDSIPQLSLGTAALIIFLICAAFLLLRGMTRMLIGVGILCASLWAGFYVWKIAPTLAIQWTGEPIAWLTTGLPAAAFLAVFLLLRTISHFIVRPFAGSKENDRPPPRRSLLKTAFLAVIPAALLWLAGATILHHIGSVAEVRASADSSPGDSPSPIAAWVQGAKDSIETIVPTALLTWLDPLTEPSRLALAKLIAHQEDPEPIIDPETGKPYPRAVIVNDPDLQTLARDGRFSTLLRHPLLTEAANDPKVQRLIQQLQN